MSSKSRQFPSWMAQKSWRALLLARYRQYVSGSITSGSRRGYATFAGHLPRSLHSRALAHPFRPPAILYPSRLNIPALPVFPAQHYKHLSAQTNETAQIHTMQRPSKSIHTQQQFIAMNGLKRRHVQTNSKPEQSKGDPLQLSVFDYLGDKSLEKSKPSYIFTHAATGFPKAGKRVISPDKDEEYASVQVGEDAYFRRYDSLGVADGVGGWTGTTGKADWYVRHKNHADV